MGSHQVQILKYCSEVAFSSICASLKYLISKNVVFYLTTFERKCLYSSPYIFKTLLLLSSFERRYQYFQLMAI